MSNMHTAERSSAVPQPTSALEPLRIPNFIEQDLLAAGVCIVQLPQRLDTYSEDAGHAEPSSITQP